MTSVTLTQYELDMAATVGVRRQVSAVASGRKHQHGMSFEDGWRAHIEGACGELALAKYLGKYWDGSVDTFRSLPDLGNIEIRTRSKSYYELIVREDDDPSKVYVLVTGFAPDYQIRGWIRGADARRDEWLQAHGGRPPAWFVPHDALTSIRRKTNV
jgi:hypothetical protein